jgi:hypothetical protein
MLAREFGAEIVCFIRYFARNAKNSRRGDGAPTDWSHDCPNSGLWRLKPMSGPATTEKKTPRKWGEWSDLREKKRKIPETEAPFPKLAHSY